MTLLAATPATTTSASVPVADTYTSTDTSSVNEALVEWVRSKPGGFVSPKVEIRRMDPSNAESPYGVFATEDVATNERLLEVPKECYIELSKEEAEPADKEGDTEEEMMAVYYRNICRLANKLKTELQLGSKRSAFGPYIRYLETQSRGQIPATWSKESKEIFRKVVQGAGKQTLPPGPPALDWIDVHFKATG